MRILVAEVIAGVAPERLPPRRGSPDHRAVLLHRGRDPLHHERRQARDRLVHHLPGVHIVNGAIIATASVVTKDVEPFVIVGGNPARRIRYRFDEPTRDALTEIAWWDWSAEKISRNVKAICSGDLEALRSAA